MGSGFGVNHSSNSNLWIERYPTLVTGINEYPARSAISGYWGLIRQVEALFVTQRSIAQEGQSLLDSIETARLSMYE